MVGANDTEWKKPDYRVTRRTLDEFGAKVESTIYVGDSPYDYETARAVGMKAYLVSTGTHSFEELSEFPDCVVTYNLEELIRLILN